MYWTTIAFDVLIRLRYLAPFGLVFLLVDRLVWTVILKGGLPRVWLDCLDLVRLHLHSLSERINYGRANQWKLLTFVNLRLHSHSEI